MAEEKSLADKLMARIQKQAIIAGIKQMLNKYPQAKAVIPLLKDGIESARTEAEKYLGEAEKLIIVGRRNGKTRLIVIDSTKPFTITTGIKIDYDADKPDTILVNKEIEDYLKEIYEVSESIEVTEEDKKKYLEMKANGFENILDLANKPIE